MRTRITVGAFATALALTACGGDDSSSPQRGGGGSTEPSAASSSSSSEAPTLDAAVAAGQEYADRVTSGDYEGAYLLSADEVRDEWTADEFVRIQEGCYKGGGVPIAVEGVRMDGEDAIVRLTVGTVKQTATMLYEDGAWHIEPSADARARYGKPVAEVVKGCQG